MLHRVARNNSVFKSTEIPTHTAEKPPPALCESFYTSSLLSLYFNSQRYSLELVLASECSNMGQTIRKQHFSRLFCGVFLLSLFLSHRVLFGVLHFFVGFVGLLRGYNRFLPLIRNCVACMVSFKLYDFHHGIN